MLQVRCGNWEVRQLSAEQQQYAACDAFASLAVYLALQQLPVKLTSSQQAIAAMTERLMQQQQQQ
jgi:ribonuclease D